MKEITKIIQYWQQSRIKLNKGASLEEIEILEKKVNFKFPDDFKEFYIHINGFKDSDWDENMFSIFPLQRIEEEYFDLEEEIFVPFCDYLINSHLIQLTIKYISIMV